MKYKETSDYHVTGYGDDDRGKRCTVAIGFGRVWLPGTTQHNRVGHDLKCFAPKEGSNMLVVLRAAQSWYRLAPEDICMPEPGWPVDADGRGLSVLEYKGIQHVHAAQHRNARAIAEADRVPSLEPLGSTYAVPTQEKVA